MTTIEATDLRRMRWAARVLYIAATGMAESKSAGMATQLRLVSEVLGWVGRGLDQVADEVEPTTFAERRAAL